jgi:lathosterol oxidase
MADGDRGARAWHFSLRTLEPTSFGSGWLSGFLSALLGVVGLGAVLCFHFPSLLVMPELRSYYAVPYVRAALHLALAASLLLGVTSLCLRRNKALGTVGVSSTLIAALLGGSRVPLDREISTGPFLGLDWFVLNLVFYSAVYVPLERWFARRPEQPTFREEWHVDLTYFFFNTLLIGVLSLLTLQPAIVLFDWARIPAIESGVSALPLVVQIAAAVLVADLTQYWVHRAFHGIPALWRFHAIHHSAEAMDWLAGSRLHVVDAVTTRAITYVPLYVLGFAEAAIYAYVAIVVIQATFIHANVRWELSALQKILVTPRYHHWHHTAEPDAVDKNFCVHTPLWDWLFGTAFQPGRWPSEYGLAGGRDVPGSWSAQLVYPFRRVS